MRITVRLSAILVMAALCSAQTYNIHGIVTDTGGTPLSGAAVWLEKIGLSDTTDADGLFTLGDTVGINRQAKSSSVHGLSGMLQNGLLRISVAQRDIVEIAAYTMKGEVISTVRQTMDVGVHTFSLPEKGAGVYLYRVKSGNSEIVVKRVSLRGKTGNIVRASQRISPISNNFAKQVAVSDSINDVIAAIKTGYLNYRMVMTNSDTSGVEIKMIASAGTMTDADGNIYQTVKIGNQVWMTENLRVTKYNDGSAIPLDTSPTTWHDTTTPKYCFYNNTTSIDSIKKYGALYNWYVVSPANPKKIAPAGWHVPTDAEWTILEKYLIANGYNYDGTTTDNKIAKSLAAKTDWDTGTRTLTPKTGDIGCDLTKNNRSGFSALPGGCRLSNGDFYVQGEYGGWWSATESDVAGAWSCYLGYGYDALGRDGSIDRNFGFSVRLLRDN